PAPSPSPARSPADAYAAALQATMPRSPARRPRPSRRSSSPPRGTEERRGHRPFAVAALSYLKAEPRSEHTKIYVRRILLKLGDVKLAEIDQATAIRLRASMLPADLSARGHQPAAGDPAAFRRSGLVRGAAPEEPEDWRRPHALFAARGSRAPGRGCRPASAAAAAVLRGTGAHGRGGLSGMARCRPGRRAGDLLEDQERHAAQRGAAAAHGRGTRQPAAPHRCGVSIAARALRRSARRLWWADQEGPVWGARPRRARPRARALRSAPHVGVVVLRGASRSLGAQGRG